MAPDLMTLFAPARGPLRTVYALYLASRAKRGLVAAITDPEQIIASVGEIESLGNSRYAIAVTDDSRTVYRVTIEVVS
jgi:hypothetical protein